MDNNNYILDILKLIDELQKNALNNKTVPVHETNNNSIYNTRPVSLYLCNNTPLSISYSNGESNVFRVEKINNNCVTVRLLAQAEDGSITPTSEYATININCIDAIACSHDISLTL